MLHALFHWTEEHLLIVGMGAFYLYSNAVGTLPAPQQNSNAFYRWFFAFNHALAGNIKYALQKAVPQYISPEK